MKKHQFLAFFLLLLFAACNNVNVKSHVSSHKKNGVKVNESLPLVKDSAITYLRLLKSVPLHESLSQLWKMDDADQKYWNYLLWDSANDIRKYPELALFDDFTATENARYHIRLGKWSIDKDSRILMLNFSDGFSEGYYIKTISVQKMVVIKNINNEQVEVTFLSDGLTQKRMEDDPFYPTNNLWRIKPTKSETDEEILNRLKQCVHFYALFFQDNHRRGATEISFDGLPNCFIWYNGGIGVPKELDLDKKWINCFYSEKEALRAYHQLENLLYKHVLVWQPHPTSWIAQTGDVLNQIHDKL